MTPEIQRPRLSAVGLLMGLSLWAAACAPTTPGPSPTVAPAKPAASPAAKVEAKPAAKAEAKPAEKPAAKVDRAAWEQTVAAAKREGKFVMIAPQGVDIMEGLSQGFQRKYPEITVEYDPIPGRSIAPKLTSELAAGINTTDLVVAGTTTVIEALMPPNAAAPIQPWLVGPETQDQSKWRGGKFNFADEAGQYNLVFGHYVKAPFVYNSNLLKASDFKAHRDLLDSKWKGRMVLGDPRVAGSGQATILFWYVTESLGKDFIRAFLAQEPLILRDDNQLIDAVAKGDRPIGVGLGDVPTIEAIRKGIPIRYMDALPEGQYVTAGNGSLSIVPNPPHPNALKVYLDWLLSREGQYEASKGRGTASVRQDVPTDHVADFLVPKPGEKYLESHLERYVTLRGEVVDFLGSILGS